MTELEKIGFEYIKNLKCYQSREHENYGYGADVVEVTINENGSAQIFMTDSKYKWCKDMAKKAVEVI